MKAPLAKIKAQNKLDESFNKLKKNIGHWPSENFTSLYNKYDEYLIVLI